ncbi:bifunctional ADP-dependent NAD(P)H-hydrate dehydratase/NAD(P)H-hydrate epimerase [Halotalea alkalilenta]|uniref:bifunctional ADP-dependent NAD(P)H-hydrate dehydratase/NAD(P)H-hydrate epimerase n=1 Tax=Halotalea alkalilenta TaxID=376489 RepID=UPI0006938F48|nr:bifunctional ADP-dependent NAD(P)H-hydrate dehydratase/NAD(P)H-hydrate epimerase [Halotalea alkalilenta]
MSTPLHTRRRSAAVEVPARLHDAAQTRALDREAIAAGISGFELMRRAGAAAFALIRQRWPKARRIRVFCGGGNNGGDGYVVAALASRAGLTVEALAFKSPETLTGEAADAVAMAREAGVAILDGETGLDQPFAADLLVDALLGTGAKGAPRGVYQRAVEAINQDAAPVLAIDLPSGVDADTGMAEQAVNAALTVSFIARKFGLYTGLAADYVGERFFDDLGLDPRLLASGEALGRLLEPAMLAEHLPPRLPSSHKGHTGHLLVVGGRPGYGGSTIMVSEAAARVGAGLVSLATDACHLAAALARRPELMVRGVRSGLEIGDLLEAADAVAIGPGLGQGAWGQGLFDKVLERPGPRVIDADALHLLESRYAGLRRDDWVLTPHPGEAAMMLGCKASQVQADRLAAARELWRRRGGVIVLKGNGTLVVAGENETDVALCPYGNPGMASGGMGDVLGGMISGLLVQGLSPFDAACAGVLVHALAADEAARVGGERGLLAGDLASFARRMVNP